MNDFLKWLGDNYKVVSAKVIVIGNTLTTTTYTLEDGRVFVSADRALVSYYGHYMSYKKGDETDKVIKSFS